VVSASASRSPQQSALRAYKRAVHAARVSCSAFAEAAQISPTAVDMLSDTGSCAVAVAVTELSAYKTATSAAAVLSTCLHVCS
jgi:hypothetical protein